MSLLIIMLAIALIAGMFYIRHKHHHKKTQTQVTPKQPIKTPLSIPLKQHAITTKTTQKAAATTPKEQFDFYAMLPKMQVNVAAKSETVNIPANQPYFLLQAATTTDNQAAQKLVTQLGVLGLNAYIKPYKRPNNTNSYRVLVGPYLTEKSAKTDSAYLSTNHMNTLLLTIKPHPKNPS